MEWIPIVVIAVLALIIVISNIHIVQQSRAENCRDQRAYRAADEPDGHQRDRRGLCHDEDDDGDQPSDHCLRHGNLLLFFEFLCCFQYTVFPNACHFK